MQLAGAAMKRPSVHIDSIAEDGHPCEAALEFRRQVIRHGIIREVSADALDMAVTFAWIGKAISRSKAIARWKINDIDPNTWEFLTALSLSHQLRTLALHDAMEAEASTGRVEELKQIRKLRGFCAAVATLTLLTSPNPQAGDVLRLAELSRIAEKLPGKKVTKIANGTANNVVLFPEKRAKKRD